MQDPNRCVDPTASGCRLSSAVDHAVRSAVTMKKGFTILELLIVAAVIVVLAGLLLPAGFRARNLARLSKCQSNQRQLCLAMAGYTADHGVFPVAGGARWLSAEGSSGLASVLACPNSTGSSYVHNRWGASRAFDERHLGLGPRGSSGTAASEVISPSACILLFDSIPVLGPPNSRPGMLALPFGTPDPSLVRLHGKDGNVGFVDGHVQTVSVDVFARGSDSIRHHWNVDNQAHDELWP